MEQGKFVQRGNHLRRKGEKDQRQGMIRCRQVGVESTNCTTRMMNRIHLRGGEWEPSLSSILSSSPFAPLSLVMNGKNWHKNETVFHLEPMSFSPEAAQQRARSSQRQRGKKVLQFAVPVHSFWQREGQENVRPIPVLSEQQWQSHQLRPDTTWIQIKDNMIHAVPMKTFRLQIPPDPASHIRPGVRFDAKSADWYF
jgi:hypothetical protein